jgi:hypothetical protein
MYDCPRCGAGSEHQKKLKHQLVPENNWCYCTKCGRGYFFGTIRRQKLDRVETEYRRVGGEGRKRAGQADRMGF